MFFGKIKGLDKGPNAVAKVIGAQNQLIETTVDRAICGLVEAFDLLPLMNSCLRQMSLPLSINGDVIGGAAFKDVACSGEGKREEWTKI